MFSIRWGQKRGFFFPDRTHGIPPYPAPALPRCSTECRLDATHHGVSGAWVRQVGLESGCLFVLAGQAFKPVPLR